MGKEFNYFEEVTGYCKETVNGETEVVERDPEGFSFHKNRAIKDAYGQGVDCSETLGYMNEIYEKAIEKLAKEQNSLEKAM